MRRARSPLAISLQGLTLRRLETLRWGLGTNQRLWLSWVFYLPGAFPFHALRLTAPRHPLWRQRGTQPPASDVATGAQRHSAFLSHLGKAPLRVLLPVSQSFKEQGSWLVSFETAGPFKVLVLVPLASRQGGCRTG